MPKKSKCHHERRNSPSVVTLRPTSSCFLMIFSISRSSTSLSCAALISFFSRFTRASFSGAVRNRLPTTSARNGGLFLVIRYFLLGTVLPVTSGDCLFRQLQNAVARNGRHPKNAARPRQKRCRHIHDERRGSTRSPMSAGQCSHLSLLLGVAKQRARGLRGSHSHLHLTSARWELVCAEWAG